ncbi:hypothetical protein U1Q18_049055 [Sarracenia purpurea var. burkii]
MSDVSNCPHNSQPGISVPYTGQILLVSENAFIPVNHSHQASSVSSAPLDTTSNHDVFIPTQGVSIPNYDVSVPSILTPTSIQPPS